MRFGVISDTHGHLPRTRAAAHMLESLEVEAVLHCGDIGSPAVPPLLDAWPTHYVLGNVDHDAQDLARAIEASGGVFHNRIARLEWEGVAIAMLHSDDARLFHQTIAGGEYQLVCYGHTHQAKLHHEGSTAVLNPGALYRTAQPSIAIVDLPALEIHHVAVD